MLEHMGSEEDNDVPPWQLMATQENVANRVEVIANHVGNVANRAEVIANHMEDVATHLDGDANHPLDIADHQEVVANHLQTMASHSEVNANPTAVVPGSPVCGLDVLAQSAETREQVVERKEDPDCSSLKEMGYNKETWAASSDDEDGHFPLQIGPVSRPNLMGFLDAYEVQGTSLQCTAKIATILGEIGFMEAEEARMLSAIEGMRRSRNRRLKKAKTD